MNSRAAIKADLMSAAFKARVAQGRLAMKYGARSLDWQQGPAGRKAMVRLQCLSEAIDRLEKAVASMEETRQ
jgi:hypothetical protein